MKCSALLLFFDKFHWHFVWVLDCALLLLITLSSSKHFCHPDCDGRETKKMEWADAWLDYDHYCWLDYLQYKTLAIPSMQVLDICGFRLNKILIEWENNALTNFAHLILKNFVQWFISSLKAMLHVSCVYLYLSKYFRTSPQFRSTATSGPLHLDFHTRQMTSQDDGSFRWEHDKWSYLPSGEEWKVEGEQSRYLSSGRVREQIQKWATEI